MKSLLLLFFACFLVAAAPGSPPKFWTGYPTAVGADRPSLSSAAARFREGLRRAAAEHVAKEAAPDPSRYKAEGWGFSLPDSRGCTDYPMEIYFADEKRGHASDAPIGLASVGLDKNRALMEAEMWRDLQALGYPIGVISGPIFDYVRGEAEYEKRASLGRYDEESLSNRELEEWNLILKENESWRSYRGLPRYMQQFAIRLARYRRQHGPHLPQVQPPGDCGAGEVPVRFDIEPDNGRAFFITYLNFRVCSLTGVKPFDRRACPFWREVSEGRPVWMSGRYMLAAVWPRGTSRRREMTIEGQSEAVIILRP